MSLVGTIIKDDLLSRVSYTVTEDQDGIIKVVKNLNRVVTNPYEGICPKGSYISIAQFSGPNFEKVSDSFTFDVDEQGKYTRTDTISV